MSIPQGDGSQPGNDGGRTPRSKRLEICDGHGNLVTVINITELRNADITNPLIVYVQQECDLGHWHSIAPGKTLPHWSD